MAAMRRKRSRRANGRPLMRGVRCAIGVSYRWPRSGRSSSSRLPSQLARARTPARTRGPSRHELDAATNTRRPAGPAGHLDQLHRHAVRGLRPERHARFVCRRSGWQPAAAPVPRLPERHHRPPADEGTVAGRRSAERPRADHAVGGGAKELQAGAHPGRLGESHRLGAVHHARRAGRDLPRRLRLGLPDPAGSRVRRDSSTR